MNKSDQPLIERYNLWLSESQVKSEFLKTKYRINNFIPMQIGSKKSFCSQETRPKTEDSNRISIIDDSDCQEIPDSWNGEAGFSSELGNCKDDSLSEPRSFKFMTSSIKSINEVEVCDKLHDTIKCTNCYQLPVFAKRCSHC